MRSLLKTWSCITVVLLLFGCTSQDAQMKPTVVVYTSVDQVYSSKIFELFEQESGIRIKALYDTEASKAVGLKKRLLAEKENPRADIFWNSEPLQTAILAQNGVFASYPSATLSNRYASDIYYDDNHSLWYGIGGRKRVIIVNTERLKPSEYPRTLEALWSKRFEGEVALSYPFAGTAATHFSALYTKLGEKHFKALLQRIRNAKTTFLSGNSVVMEAVASGQYLVGIVDTDDVKAGLREEKKVEEVHYDQNGSGNFLLFGTVSLIKGAPNPETAKKFMEFLLRPETEKLLIEEGAIDTPLLSGGHSGCKSWSVEPETLAKSYRQTKRVLQRLIR